MSEWKWSVREKVRSNRMSPVILSHSKRPPSGCFSSLNDRKGVRYVPHSVRDVFVEKWNLKRYHPQICVQLLLREFQGISGAHVEHVNMFTFKNKTDTQMSELSKKINKKKKPNKKPCNYPNINICFIYSHLCCNNIFYLTEHFALPLLRLIFSTNSAVSLHPVISPLLSNYSGYARLSNIGSTKSSYPR